MISKKDDTWDFSNGMLCRSVTGHFSHLSGTTQETRTTNNPAASPSRSDSLDESQGATESEHASRSDISMPDEHVAEI